MPRLSTWAYAEVEMITTPEYRDIRTLADVLTMRRIAENMQSNDPRVIDICKILTGWMNDLWAATENLVGESQD